MKPIISRLVAVSMAVGFLTDPGAGAFAREKKQIEIPHCARPLGTLAVVEPETRRWEQYGLGSPEAVLKYYVSESRCFKLQDRGRGMETADRERALAAAGVLRPGSRIGKGQVRAVDYVLVPDLLSSNKNSGGNAIGGIIGTAVGGVVGAILGGIKVNKKTADVTLSLMDVRSSDEDIVVRGSAKNTDIGWAAGGAAGGGDVFGGAAVAGYKDTEVGKVIMTAYLDAYVKLVERLGGLPSNAADASPGPALVTTAGLKLRSGPSTRDSVVRTLAAGALLYPTGEEAAGWIAVTDEMQYRGWVSKLYVQPAR